VLPFLLAVSRAHRVAGPEQLEHVGFSNELEQAGLPLLTSPQREHVLQVLAAEGPDGVIEAFDDRVVQVGVAREDLLISRCPVGYDLIVRG
jgi:hypothetical protein